MTYKRILLKISGESLSGNSEQGINFDALYHFASEIKSVYELNTQIGIVIGGGNIFRGLGHVNKGFDRIQGDYMGMLATIINSMALQGELEKMQVKSVILSGLAIDPVCEKMSSRKAVHFLETGHVVIMAGGTGNPFFTTDSGGALRSIEIKADVLLKGTRVDGVYDKDPEKHKDAVKYNDISFEQAYEKNLHIMDLTAFTLCKENNMPIIVFDMNQKDNLKKIITGENIGTLIH
jgi:uridylate kinase